MIKVFYNWKHVREFLFNNISLKERCVNLDLIVRRNDLESIFGNNLCHKLKGDQKIYIYLPQGIDGTGVAFIFDFSGENPIEILQYIPPLTIIKPQQPSSEESRKKITLDEELAKLIAPNCIKLLNSGEYDEYNRTYGFYDKIISAIMEIDPEMDKKLKIAKLLNRKWIGKLRP